jgi:nucleoside triphosphate pyrophosphatase
MLEAIGLRAEIRPSEAPEDLTPGAAPEVEVQRLALQKASDVARQSPGAIVLGADTIVVLHGEILGKPENPGQAREMLRKLSSRRHTVFTGIALVHEDSNRSRTDFAATEVFFGTLTNTEIDRYVAGGSPLDKAGAYGIQDDAGSLFIDRINGDYNTVVGLPLRKLYLLIQSEFGDLLKK